MTQTLNDFFLVVQALIKMGTPVALIFAVLITVAVIRRGPRYTVHTVQATRYVQKFWTKRAAMRAARRRQERTGLMFVVDQRVSL